MKRNLLLLGLVFATLKLFAQPPSNDECTSAIQLTVNSNSSCTNFLNANTGQATQSLSPCVGSIAKDVWYKFDATAASHRFTITPVSYCNLVLQLYSGNCVNLVSMGCIYPSGNNEQIIGLFNNLTIGATYYLRVYDRYGNGPNLDFTICVSTTTTYIENDECTGAINIVPSPNTSCNFQNFSNVGATQSMPGCNGTAEDDIWFKFVATATRQQVWVTTSQSIYPVIEVFSNTCGSLVPIGCYHPGNGGYDQQNTADLLNLITGNTYYYRVYGQAATNNRCDISTCIKTLPPVPVNDECNGAIPLTVNSSSSCTTVLNANTGHATQSLSPCVGNIASDVWYKFDAIASAHRITITPVSYCNLVLELYSGTCGNLVSMGCIYPSGFNEEVIGMFTNLTVGSTYYLRVYDRFGNGPDLDFNICVNMPTSLCGGGNTYFVANVAGSSFQWQVNPGTGFTNLSNSVNYSGVNTNIVGLNSVPASWYGYQYRCIVDGSVTSVTYIIRFVNYWNGSVSNQWENPGNWSCNTLPDANTDVIISTGQIIVNSNRSCRSITLSPGTNVTVNSGFNLNLVH